MIYIDFYKDFFCKADKCRHSCCRAGWEIDIDKDTAEYYKTMPGKLGDKVRANAVLEPGAGEESHLKMNNGSCPMLLENGLCEIVKTCGEDRLCDICHLHPRFYGEYEGMEYAGVGLCCEKSCELLLNSEEQLGFLTDSNDNYSLLKDISALEYSPEFTVEDIAELLDIYSRTEPLNEAWTKHISDMRASVDSIKKRVDNYTKEYNRAKYNRIFAYIVYRQIDRLYDYSWEDLKTYALICTDFIFIEDAIICDTAEAVRIFSEQIEYCPENVDMIFDYVAV